MRSERNEGVVLDDTAQRCRVSIVINTDGRVKALTATLESLRHLNYPDFEVCVVPGPTLDGTKELVESWADRIKIGYCPTRNLSQSRNIGLALSAGDVVAFLDDDAIPEPEWLTQVVAPFSDARVAVCGGFLLDHTGVNFQWRFGTANRMGLADTTWERAAPEFNFPYSANFPHVIGANSVFRRSALIEVGGFDEQYIYFLDETDVICRLVDHGYHVAQLDGARVHHKFAASHTRTESRLLTSWYAIIRSKIYFSLVNAHGHHDAVDAIKDAHLFVEKLEKDLDWAIAAGKLPADLRARFKDDVDRAFRSGLSEGLSANRLFYDAPRLAHHVRAFLPFPALVPSGVRRTICFLTQAYPPGPIGGIGRYIHQLARTIAMLGHQVHVLTRANGQDTVDLEDGVWVHRLEPKRHSVKDVTRSISIPDHIWDYSATMRDELRRIASQRNVDGVYAPIWDCEGIAVLLSGEFKLITSLQTTLAFWLDSHEHMRDDQSFMDSFAVPMLAAERLLFENSDGIIAISAAIAHDIERTYGVDFTKGPMVIVPLGQEDWSSLPLKAVKQTDIDAVRLLFVGRLEKRKGIDVLLAALPSLLRHHPLLHVDIVGNESLPESTGRTYRSSFEAACQGESFLSRVQFHGEIEDDDLRGFYSNCDLFVAPSRFESFGLILLEAMMFSKPVIACRAGGMVEVIEDGVSGLLAEPGNVASLSRAITSLVEDSALRESLGREGRQRYEALFTPQRMAEGVLSFLDTLSVQADRREELIDDAG